MRKNAPMTYLERKARCRAIHKWLKNSKNLHLPEDKGYNIDVPVDNDITMEHTKRGKKNYDAQKD